MEQPIPPHIIRRLRPGDAPAISACFRRVYGDSYANELFYDAARLAEQMRAQRLRCVGAVTDANAVLGHMAMTVTPGARIPELGNTVVDPAARGAGLAWQVGAELTAWCSELGFPGFLHYPTTDHHIMQRHSVKDGFEMGLMLGYIPAATDGKVHAPRAQLRQAATIVYAPLRGDASQQSYLPAYCADLLRHYAQAAGLDRRWQAPDSAAMPASSTTSLSDFPRRGLQRLKVARVGAKLARAIQALDAAGAPCRQIDLSMADPAIGEGVAAAREAGYTFCGWLPGFAGADVFRLQRVVEHLTDLEPGVVNPAAQELLARLRAERDAQ